MKKSNYSDRCGYQPAAFYQATQFRKQSSSNQCSIKAAVMRRVITQIAGLNSEG